MDRTYVTDDKLYLWNELNVGDYVLVDDCFSSQEWFSYKPVKVMKKDFGFLVDVENKRSIHISFISSAKNELREEKLKRILDDD